jgi:hypothetical protein
MKRLLIAVMLCAIPLMAAAKDQTSDLSGRPHVSVIPLSQCREDLRQLHAGKAEKCFDDNFFDRAYNKYHGRRYLVLSACTRRITNLEIADGDASSTFAHAEMACVETAAQSGLKWQSAAECMKNHPASYCMVPPKTFPTTHQQQTVLSREFGNQIAEDVAHVWHPSLAICSARVRIHLARNGDVIGKPKIISSCKNQKFENPIMAAIKAKPHFKPPTGLHYVAYKTVTIFFNAGPPS